MNSFFNFGVIERVIRIIEEHGIFKIIQALLVMFAFIYLMYHVSAIPDVVDNVFTERFDGREIQHDSAVVARRAIKPEVDNILTKALSTLNADRAFVIEMHNGTNNTAGLPFIYGEMTYEEVKDGIYHVDEDYSSVNLSRFSLPLYLERHKLFCGSVADLSSVDKKLSERISSNDVTYIAIICMFGASNELGYFGVTYCEGHTPPEKQKILEALAVNSQKLSILLDNKTYGSSAK